MSQTDFFREQATAARRLADTSMLPNVRARYLNSHTVWTRLADQAEQLERMQAAGVQASWS